MSKTALLDLAYAEAQRLEDTTLGPWHVLLGLAGGESAAAQALRDCGATYERLVDAYERRRARWEKEYPREEGDGASPNPAFYAFLGRTEGFAAAMGSMTLAPEHALLSLVWDPTSVHSGMLHELGTSRAEVQRALARLGVPVPPNDPPPEDERPVGERVWIPIEHFDVLLHEVQSRLPPQSPFGFNFTTDGRAWMRAGADVDLQAIVDDVLARHANGK